MIKLIKELKQAYKECNGNIDVFNGFVELKKHEITLWAGEEKKRLEEQCEKIEGFSSEYIKYKKDCNDALKYIQQIQNQESDESEPISKIAAKVAGIPHHSIIAHRVANQGKRYIPVYNHH